MVKKTEKTKETLAEKIIQQEKKLIKMQKADAKNGIIIISSIILYGILMVQIFNLISKFYFIVIAITGVIILSIPIRKMLYSSYKFRLEEDILHNLKYEEQNTFEGSIVLINGDEIQGTFLEYRLFYLEKSTNTEYLKDKIIAVSKKK